MVLQLSSYLSMDTIDETRFCAGNNYLCYSENQELSAYIFREDLKVALM